MSTNAAVLISREIPLRRRIPEGLHPNLVSHFTAQHQPDYFLVSFFEVWPPVILADTEEERQTKLSQIGDVEALCVSRIALTPTRMRELIQVLTDNLAQYDRMMESIASSTQEG